MGFDRIWRIRKWLGDRHGQRCRVLAYGALNSCLIEFDDGTRVVADRRFIRKVVRNVRSQMGKKKGICFVCGCTEEDACPQGCSWANVKQTLCTVCEPLSEERRQERTRHHREVMIEVVRTLQRRLDAMNLA